EEGLEAGAADAGAVHQPEDQVAVDLLRLAVVAYRPHLVPGRQPAGARLEQGLDLLAGGGGEDLAVGAEQLQAVPPGGVVAGGDLHAAGGLQGADGQADGGGGGDAGVVDLAAGGREPGEDGVPEQGAGGPAVAADDDAAAADVGGQRLREGEGDLRREALADD